MAATPPPPPGGLGFFNAIRNYMTQGPGYDWEKIVQQWLDPYQRMYEEQMAALQAQASQQRELAQSNSGIDARRMEILHKKAIYDIKNSMGARGLTNSGENHYQINKENELYQLAMKGNANALQAYLQNLANSLSNQQLAGLQSLQQQRLGLLSSLPGLYPPSTATQPWWTKPGAAASAPATSGPMTPPGGWGWGG